MIVEYYTNGVLNSEDTFDVKFEKENSYAYKNSKVTLNKDYVFRMRMQGGELEIALCFYENGFYKITAKTYVDGVLVDEESDDTMKYRHLENNIYELTQFGDNITCIIEDNMLYMGDGYGMILQD